MGPVHSGTGSLLDSLLPVGLLCGLADIPGLFINNMLFPRLSLYGILVGLDTFAGLSSPVWLGKLRHGAEGMGAWTSPPAQASLRQSWDQNPGVWCFTLGLCCKSIFLHHSLLLGISMILV